MTDRDTKCGKYIGTSSNACTRHIEHRGLCTAAADPVQRARPFVEIDSDGSTSLTYVVARQREIRRICGATFDDEHISSINGPRRCTRPYEHRGRCAEALAAVRDHSAYSRRSMSSFVVARARARADQPRECGDPSCGVRSVRGPYDVPAHYGECSA